MNSSSEIGTGKFIYDVVGKYAHDGSFHDEKWPQVSIELYSFIQGAFQSAHNKGYLGSSDFEDMTVSAITIGWDFPDTFNAGFQFKNVSLKAFLK